MADYVRKTILSQSYVHIDEIELTDAQKKQYVIDVRTYQEPRAKRFLYADITPEVRTKDGSFIVYTTVYGSLSKALGDFSHFTSALDQLYASSKMLAEACILESLFLSKLTRKQLLRSEARTGVVKTTKDLFDAITLLGAEVSADVDPRREFGTRRISKAFEHIRERSDFLITQLSEAPDRKLIAKQLGIALRHLPAEQRQLTGLRDRQALAIYQQERVSAINFASGLTRDRDTGS